MDRDHSLPIGKRTVVLLAITGVIAIAVCVLAALVIHQLFKIEKSPSTTNTTADGDTKIVIGPRRLNADTIESIINDERQKLSLPPLAHSETLRASACAKLDHMVEYDYWAHTAPDGTEPWHFFTVVGYAYTKAGENLAYGQMSESEVVANWMNSPTHRDNIVGNFVESGVCTRLEKFQGSTQTITVHHFGTR